MLRSKLQGFFMEDIGERDLTSESIFPKNQVGKGKFVAKASGIVAGLVIIEEAYRVLDQQINVQFFYERR